MLRDLVAGAAHDASTRREAPQLRRGRGRRARPRSRRSTPSTALAPADRVKIIAEVKRAEPVARCRWPRSPTRRARARRTSTAARARSACSPRAATSAARSPTSRPCAPRSSLPVLRKDFIADAVPGARGARRRRRPRAAHRRRARPGHCSPSCTRLDHPARHDPAASRRTAPTRSTGRADSAPGSSASTRATSRPSSSTSDLFGRLADRIPSGVDPGRRVGGAVGRRTSPTTAAPAPTSCSSAKPSSRAIPCDPRGVPGGMTRAHLTTQRTTGPYFGEYGGRFVPESLVAALDELSAAYEAAKVDPAFQAELRRAARFVHRPAIDHHRGAPLRPARRRRPGLPQARRPQPHRQRTRSTTCSVRRCSPSASARPG